MQQRLLQRIQRGKLPLVEAGEALGFFAEVGQHGNDGLLFLDGVGNDTTTSPIFVGEVWRTFTPEALSWMA